MLLIAPFTGIALRMQQRACLISWARSKGQGVAVVFRCQDGVCGTLSGNQVTKPRNDHSNCVCMCVRAIRPAALTAGCAMLSRIQPLLWARVGSEQWKKSHAVLQNARQLIAACSSRQLLLIKPFLQQASGKMWRPTCP